MQISNLSVLQELRVLRLGQALCGDFLAAILCDAGAQVTSATGLDESALRAALRESDVVVNDLGRGASLPPAIAQAIEQRPLDLIECTFVSFPDGAPQGLPELEDDPVMAVLGLNRMVSDAPQPEPLRMPSLYAAQTAALHIGCALLQRDRNGPVRQRIEVSLFGSALNVLGRQMVAFGNPAFRDPLSYGWRLPTAHLRRCADGRFIQPHGMFPHFISILMTAAGHPEWARDAAEALHYLPDAAAVALWNERMDAMFLRRPAADWERLINEAGGACTVCRTRDEWAHESHARTAGMLGPGSDEGSWQPGPGVLVEAASNTRGALRTSPSPSGSRPLSGVRIVDFCIIIAGPTVGRVLADLGADVVKVDAPNRYINPCLWLDVNRGKRSIVLDLRDPDGRDVAARLVADADVVLENFRAGKLEQLGFGYGSVSRSRPEVIYVSTNAMDLLGPWAPRPGWEHNAQAATGMQWARATGDTPLHVPFPVNDYATGLFGALGVVWALLHRQRTGQGARVRGSLARSATYLQRFDSGPVAKPRLGTHSFRCADGWVTAYFDPRRNAAPSAQWAGLAAEAATLPCEELIARFASEGWAAARENAPADLLKQAWLFAAGLMLRWRHPTLGEFSQSAPHARNSTWTFSPGHPAPEPGADNDALLNEAGLGHACDLLRQRKAISSLRFFEAVGRS